MVFDGCASPYRSTDQTNPLTEYGCQKLEAEKQVLQVTDQNLAVLRITLLNGNSPRETEVRTKEFSWLWPKAKTPILLQMSIDRPVLQDNVAQLIVELIERPNF